MERLYREGANIMQVFRDMDSSQVNSLEGILVAYDLQAGSYVKRVREQSPTGFNARFTAAVAEILDRYSPRSILEAGVGEATTLANVLPRMQRPPADALGFDISWSRIAVAREYCAGRGVSPLLFTGNLTEIPVSDDAVEVVYTSNSVEPNRGREAQTPG